MSTLHSDANGDALDALRAALPDHPALADALLTVLAVQANTVMSSVHTVLQAFTEMARRQEQTAQERHAEVMRKLHALSNESQAALFAVREQELLLERVIEVEEALTPAKLAPVVLKIVRDDMARNLLWRA